MGVPRETKAITIGGINRPSAGAAPSQRLRTGEAFVNTVNAYSRLDQKQERGSDI
jgi:hypothetical protein